MKERSNLDWLEVQLSTLYVCGSEGRLRFIHEPGYTESELDPAPRFFMGRSAEGNLWRFHHDLPEDVTLELDGLCRAEPTPSNLRAEPRQAGAIRAVLERHSSIAGEERGPAYRLPETSRQPRAAIIVTEENAQVLERYFPWKLTSRNSFSTGPLAASVVNDHAVSICYCARLTDAAAEAGVETTESARGLGHAGAAVAVWAAAIQSRGLLPLYSTSWDNAASQRVAQKLGAVMYGEDWWIT